MESKRTSRFLRLKAIYEVSETHLQHLTPCCYNAGRPFSLSCIRAMAPPVKSLRTCTVSRWRCSDSRTNSCWVSASCCTDSDKSSRERETVSSRMLVACCSWRLSEALCSMLSLAFWEDWPGIGSVVFDVEGPEGVWGGACFWMPLFPWWSPLSFVAWVEGSRSSLWSSSESANAASASWVENNTNKCFLWLKRVVCLS